MRPSVGLDVDGVVADTYRYVLTEMGIDPELLTTYAIGDSFSQDITTEVHRRFERPETYVACPPLPGAKEAVNMLWLAGCPPVFISSFPSRFHALRQWWIETHFGLPLELHSAPHGRNAKVRIAERCELTHFVEDKRETANEMAEAGITSILVPTTYHNDGPIDPRVKVQALYEFAKELTNG